MKEWITEAIQGLDVEIEKLQDMRLNLVALADGGMTKPAVNRKHTKPHHAAKKNTKGLIACDKKGCERLFNNRLGMRLHFTRAHTAAGKAAFKNASAKRDATMAARAKAT